MSFSLPLIPAKRYFTIGEVAELCGVKPHVLRYWEQEFGQLRPMKRRGNRRYYQHHEVLMIRRIRELLHVQGMTIQDARDELQAAQSRSHRRADKEVRQVLVDAQPFKRQPLARVPDDASLESELRAIRALLAPPSGEETSL